ncbi:MAG: hypothetical protein EP330_14320 [Deltaproteobacteria bacterium]|nr:MAG: hypothetical protein EP330_14320 [Deltaproteobacteria bacterium]
MPRFLRFALLLFIVVQAAYAGRDRCTLCGGRGFVYDPPTEWEFQAQRTLILTGGTSQFRSCDSCPWTCSDPAR